jgi:hypothetical protein
LFGLVKNDGEFEVDSEFAKFIVRSLEDVEFRDVSLSIGFVKGKQPVNIKGPRVFNDKKKKSMPAFTRPAGEAPDADGFVKNKGYQNVKELMDNFEPFRKKKGKNKKK